MDNSPLLLMGFEVRKNNQVIIDGNSLDCVFDHVQMVNRRKNGMQMEDLTSVEVKTADLEFPRNYLKKIITIDEQTYEVVGISKGEATSLLALEITNKL